MLKLSLTFPNLMATEVSSRFTSRRCCSAGPSWIRLKRFLFFSTTRKKCWGNFRKTWTQAQPRRSLSMDFCFLLEYTRITPRTIERYAATNTRYCAGKVKVMVCAGIQNRGMVLKTTNVIKAFQSMFRTSSCNDGFLWLTRISI